MSDGTLYWKFDGIYSVVNTVCILQIVSLPNLRQTHKLYRQIAVYNRCLSIAYHRMLWTTGWGVQEFVFWLTDQPYTYFRVSWCRPHL